MLTRLCRWLEAGLLAPCCLHCHGAVPSALPICADCAAGLRPAPALPEAPAPCGGVRLAAFRYEGTAAALITAYKFGEDLAAGRVLARLALPALREADRPEALVPVPLHRQRLRQRGHDQALGLARDWGRALGLPVRAGLLRRQRATLPQTTLDARGRAGNVAGAFEAHGPCPAHVALVDDVLTTGSTVAAAAEALFAAGARRVDAWVLAWAAPPGGGAQPAAMK
ncbi:ComF family protein [Silanimonas lenta]|uniref:ComF family protein n=1 Tax=Silanimonas lenta TaxID=265429 RepID=UPI000414277B|nr:ComF family protein [Silanimonas lenta]